MVEGIKSSIHRNPTAAGRGGMPEGSSSLTLFFCALVASGPALEVLREWSRFTWRSHACECREWSRFSSPLWRGADRCWGKGSGVYGMNRMAVAMGRVVWDVKRIEHVHTTRYRDRQRPEGVHNPS